MNNSLLGLWLKRILAFVHFLYAIVLFSGALWLAVSAFKIIPYMTCGTVFTNIPNALFIGFTQGAPLILAALLFSAAGWGIWSHYWLIKKYLLWFHGLSIIFSAGLIIIGIHAVKAAEASCAKGGGILSPIAWVPIIIGVPIMSIAIFTFTIALLINATK